MKYILVLLMSHHIIDYHPSNWFLIKKIWVGGCQHELYSLPYIINFFFFLLRFHELLTNGISSSQVQ